VECIDTVSRPHRRLNMKGISAWIRFGVTGNDVLGVRDCVGLHYNIDIS